MKRSQLGRGTKRLRARPKPVDQRLDEDAIRQAVFRRDGRRCQLDGVAGAGACSGRLTYQHRRKAGQGGPFSVENGAALCLGHNCAIEADADLARLARRRGLVLLAGDDPTIPHLPPTEPTPEEPCPESTSH